jgi:hypothetical protein
MNHGYCNVSQFEAQGFASQVRPFSIRIFCPDGNPVGLRILSKSNWTGCGLVCPRSILPAVKSRKEFSQPGVYVLVAHQKMESCPRYTLEKVTRWAQGWSSIMPTKNFGHGLCFLYPLIAI